ncbi:MAG: anti-sigma factor [Candidatus Dormibacteraeota bacterium]|nr:anti-sigma factor [Candidatus Dormibacteraeota bacterium]
MTALRCDQVEELLGAYALQAVSASEALDVQNHLATCAEHRKTAKELQDTVSLLALVVEEQEPSYELRGRIMASIKSAATEPAGVPEPVPVVVPIRRAPRLPRWAPRPAFAAMAAAALLAIGVGTYGGYRFGQDSSAAMAYRFSGSLLAPTARANLVYLRDRHQAVLAVDGLPPLAPGQVYEMWLIDRSGVPIPEGVAAAPDGRITAQMSADLSKFRQFAITIEPGERPSPTTQPILLGALSGTSA